MRKEKLWFKSKDYGWGWYPSSWEGWAAIGAYLLLVILISKPYVPYLEVGDPAGTLSYSLLLIGLTFLLVAVSAAKGEKPEWRWGGKPLRRKKRQ